MNIFENVYWYFKNSSFKPRLMDHPRIYIPQKPRLHLDADFSKSVKWIGIVEHHTGSYDNPNRLDYEREVRYHTSFRINYKEVASPVKERLPGVQYVLFKNMWYRKDEYDKYMERKKLGDGKAFEDAWSYAGYHIINEYIDNSIRLHWARPLWVTGAHAGIKGKPYYNLNYIGIATIGNFDKNEVPKDLWDHNLALARTLMDIYGFPRENVIGHRETYIKLGVPVQKQCPGSKWNMIQFRKEL